MSKWRQKGFVQDSDEEEEESQLESQGSKPNAVSNGRVERVDIDASDRKDGKDVENNVSSTTTSGHRGNNAISASFNISGKNPPRSPATSGRSPRRPTASPLTPVATSHSSRDSTQSPDPLQSSPNPRFHKSRQIVPSQLLGSPILGTTSPPPGAQRQNEGVVFSHVSGTPSFQADVPVSSGVRANVSSNVLGAFGIYPLSEASEDEPLSDPPSDLESPDAGSFAAKPHRRTAVQVVIPSSTALQKHLYEEEARREFRQRKPIQLHPYALEGELYRREVRSRGLKPVPRPRSPEQRTGAQDVETQEKEFDPHATPDSSPPEAEIPVSAPIPRKPRADRPQGSANRTRIMDPAKRRTPGTQLRLPHTAKRRKLNVALSQATAQPTSIFDDNAVQRDIWSVPPNSPPYSSSPRSIGRQSARSLNRNVPIATATNLLTPSTSSVFQDDQIGRSTRQPSSEQQRPTRIILSDLSSSSSDSSQSEAEQSDHELKKVSKKIKGVLPASWLRFDQQAQERRQAQQRARERERLRQLSELSPDPEPQRGIAQRVPKRTAVGRNSMALVAPAEDIVVISDGSDHDSDDHIYNHPRDMQTPVEDAESLAAVLNRRYADDDSDNMEHDHLNLFTMGGTGSKRKKQTKLADAFENAKRLKAATSTTKKAHSDRPKKRQHHDRSARTKRTPPPALSVVDADFSLSKQSDGVPQFLRLARRQALRRPDLARQSPRTKQIRLHNLRDTEDANAALQQWRQGGLRPKKNLTLRKPGSVRSPLTDRTDNQQLGSEPTPRERAPHKDLGIIRDTPSSASRHQRLTTRPSALKVFQRTIATTSTKTAHRAKPASIPHKVLQRTDHMAPFPFRAGQLERDERAFGHEHRKSAFEKGLRHVNLSAAGQCQDHHDYMNPQIARYLADAPAGLPLVLSPSNIGEEEAEHGARQAMPSRRRLVRKKMRVQRLDVDAREFRQPSEQAVQECLSHKIGKQHDGITPLDGLAILHGLGPFGTRYPTTFDVAPLQADTYFHSSTLVGSEDLRSALSIGQSDSRDLDELVGYCIITHNESSIRCGPWNDETSSALSDFASQITAPLDAGPSRSDEGDSVVKQVLQNLARFMRSVIRYVSSHLSFSDPVDRRSFVLKMQQQVFSMFDQVSVLHQTSCHHESGAEIRHGILRAKIYLLVLNVQTCLVAQSIVADQHVLAEVQQLTHSIAKSTISQIVLTQASELGEFYEENKRHAVREKGIRDEQVVAEGVVVCMHALEKIGRPGMGFWDIVSQELTSTVTDATHMTAFETAWATLFSLIPLIDVDISGIPLKSRRESFPLDNWSCVSVMLRRLFELYPSTQMKYSSSLNDYVRANLARCHRLIKFWHWQRPEQMLNAVFDFFGRNGLRQLQRESTSGSVALFDHTTAGQPLSLEGTECAFHIALKCLALGLRGMKTCHTEKKIRSFVFRTIPNHGRNYPKDQPLDEESLAALRNHHDLLSTLYWAAPPLCRPKLELVRGLVSHANSHREACRVNVRAWANLTAFQLSSDEQYAAAQPFALWHKEIMHQTLKQYRLARSEADDYLKSGVLDGTTELSAVMVRQTMQRNQEQVIATLRDCIQGMRTAIQAATDHRNLKTFLVDSEIVHLLELPHLEDRRLVNVIRDALALLREYASLQKTTPKPRESQPASEDSQDYGDFPDMDDLDDLESNHTKVSARHTSLDFVQSPLWHLMSNAFGAEISPDDNLLMDCVDTWVVIAEVEVACGAKSWSHYLDSFSQMSWHQLRQTEQTRKFGPYFLACLASEDSTAYEHHRHDFNTALLLSLVDRESTLRFQHRLLHSMLNVDKSNPLLKNPPFFRDEVNGEWDINYDTLRARRHALISSILSNIRDDMYATASENPARTSEVRRVYAAMLHDLMTRMKGNYLQLQQGTTVAGSYVDFVQKVVQFLKQYTGDICPVITFFTDSVAFPLPSTDPTYVVGRLCGYAPKAREPGTAKQLSVFVQTVAQQAATDNQQSYLVEQLTTALCSDETPVADRRNLRAVLLQAIFPVYLEKAFSSSTSFLIANPILQCLSPILDTLIFDLRMTQSNSISSTMDSVLAVAHAFIRGTERIADASSPFDQPWLLSVSSHMLQAAASILPVLEYICSKTTNAMHPVVTYMRGFSMYLTERLEGTEPQTVLDYEGDAHTTTAGDQSEMLLAFCRRGLEDSLRANWSEDADGVIRFGQGHARKDVVFDIGTMEEEKARLVIAVQSFQGVLRNVFGEDVYHCDAAGSTAYDVVV